MAEASTKSQCTYCQEDIAGLLVKCAECPDFELCLQCFSAGAEIGTHKNDHPYQFVDPGATSITFGRNAWTAREEKNLLDAIEYYSFGNWEDISKEIKTRTPDEVKEQYLSRYLDGIIGRLTWPPALRLRPNIVTSSATVDTGPLSPSSSARLPPLDITQEEAKQLGYMPLRDDFDREFDNDAETLVSPLTVNATEDEDLDIALKLVHVDIYIQRLRERARRKRVARDYQLVSQFFHASRKDNNSLLPGGNGSSSNASSSSSNGKHPPQLLHVHKRSMTQEEREFQEGMRVFSQFHTAHEHDQFLANMQREQELRIRLGELIRYRRHGITRHEECAHFEQEFYFQQEAQLRDRNNACGTPNGSIAGSSGATLNSLLFPLPPGGTNLRKKDGNDEVAFCSSERRSLLVGLGSPYKDSVEGGAGSRNGETQTQLLPSTRHLLSRQENALCSALGLAPHEFLTVKTLILKDATEEKKDCINEITPLEGHVRTYMQTQGWLPV